MKEKKAKKARGGLLRDIAENKASYILLLPAVIYVLIFSYFSYPYVMIAFKEFGFGEGVFGGKWVGFKNFEFFFKSTSAATTITNTLSLNLMFIVFGTLSALILALMLNEIKRKTFLRVAQSMILMPHYLSWVVIGFMLYSLFSLEMGLFNNMARAMGLEAVNWYATPGAWPPILVVMNVWKTTGLNAIIYLAAITAIDETLYESAVVDGASRFKQCIHITIPLVLPTVCIMTIMAIGKIFYGDFGMIYALIGDNGVLYPTTDIIDTYVFRALRQTGDSSQAMAVGLSQSVMGCIMVLGANTLTKRFFKDGALF